jgi:hypothetical protein
MRNSPALDVEGTLRRPVETNTIAFEHDRVVARPGQRERGRESRDAAPSDDAQPIRPAGQSESACVFDAH